MENDNVKEVLSRLVGADPPLRSPCFPLRRGSPSGGPTDADLLLAQSLLLVAASMSAILKKAEASFESGGATWSEVAELRRQCRLFAAEFERFVPIINGYLRFLGKLELLEMEAKDFVDETGEAALELRLAAIDAEIEWMDPLKDFLHHLQDPEPLETELPEAEPAELDEDAEDDDDDDG